MKHPFEGNNLTIRSTVGRLLRSMLTLAAGAIVVLSTACAESVTRPDPFTETEVGIVVNSVELTLTIFSVDDPASQVTVALGADGSPVGLALRNGIAAVPMGTFPALAIVDVADGVVLRTVGLPEGSGATGSAFLNDSIVLVANPGLGTVSPVNVRTGIRGNSIDVGAYPQGVVVQGGKAFVVNAELGSDFQPARSGTVTVLDAQTLDVRSTIDLSAENPGGATVGPDGRLYIINGGRWGQNNGSLSIIDPMTEMEVAHHRGFGDFPGSAATDAQGRLYVTSFSVGLMVWDPSTATFVRGPDDAVTPGGVASVSGVGFDAEGRLHTLFPDCQNPSLVHRLTSAFEVELEIPAGICPIGIAFGMVSEPAGS